MAITVICPGCSTELAIEADGAGKTFECARCGTAVSVPLSTAPEPAVADPSSPDTKFCHDCGKSIRKKAAICPDCGVRQPRVRGRRSDDADYDPELANAGGKKLAAGLCGIFVGGFGVHKFILGYNRPGIIMLCASLLTCGIGYTVVHIIGIVEGILYLTKTDEEFNRIYLVGKKEWF